MSGKLFVSGDEAVALAVRQAKPHVIAAYPITPQTIVVERLSDFVEDGSLESEYLYVESEHSAMTACLGASAMGARAFTATSSQGLLYMVEGLHYASGQPFHRHPLEHLRRPARLFGRAGIRLGAAVRRERPGGL